MRCKLLASLAVSLLGVLAAPAAVAALACPTPEAAQAIEQGALARGYDTALAALLGCLGDAKGDTTPVVVEFNQKTPAASDWAARKKNLQAALDTLEKYSGTRAQSSPDRAQWIIVHDQVLHEIALVQTLGAVDEAGGVFLDNTFWLQDGRPGTPVAHNTIELTAPTNCAAPPAACPAYDLRKDQIRFFNLVRRLGDYADVNKVNAHLKDAQALDKTWKAYFNDTRPQYWWEILYNGYTMKKQYCQNDPSTEIQVGFCKVPEHQWILLHPSAALQWVNGADDKDDLEAAFAVEIFGRNSWTWNDGVPKRQWGWSVLTAYSNRGTDLKKWSYGLMFSKGKDMKIGFTTTSDNEFGILLTTSVAGKFFEQKQKYLDYLKAKDKDAMSWLDLLD